MRIALLIPALLAAFPVAQIAQQPRLKEYRRTGFRSSTART